MSVSFVYGTIIDKEAKRAVKGTGSEKLKVNPCSLKLHFFQKLADFYLAEYLCKRESWFREINVLLVPFTPWYRLKYRFRREVHGAA